MNLFRLAPVFSLDEDGYQDDHYDNASHKHNAISGANHGEVYIDLWGGRGLKKERGSSVRIKA